MKVSFLAGTLGRGGAERQLLYMLRAAQSAGIETRVLCLTRGESYEEEIESLGIPVEWVGNSPNRWKRLINIIQTLRKYPADVVQSSHFFTNIYAGIAGKILRIPSIGAVRSDLTYEVKLHKSLGKWQISLPRFLITNSDTAKKRAIERGISPQNIAFVRNVVETGNGAMTNRRPDKKEIRVIFVGRLDELKRPDKFVHLAQVLTGKYPRLPLRFQIAGDGKLKSDLLNLAKNLKLPAEKLEFLGNCREMHKVYNQADLLVSTSAREGTSNVILEAMAYGLPVIATNVGGTPEILDQTRGILIELDNEKALVSSAEKLILDENLRCQLGRAGKEYVGKNHSLDYLEDQLTGIYERLLSQ